MGKTVLFSLVFIGLISLTYTRKEDDSELLQKIIDALSDPNDKHDVLKNIKRNLGSNDVRGMNERKSDKDERIGNNFGTRQGSGDPNGHEYYVNIPEHTSQHVHKDDDLYRAIDSFLQAKRARAWLKWLEHGGHKGTSTTTAAAPTFTTTAPTTLPPTTAAPTTAPTTRRTYISWCRISWWGWRRRC
ncbi:uncharacterized protein LOC132759237 [Ruditapes philippinarum]|uniref:uncharacterized protein LOC132759237 n=1 Tax=Ruditapes philippinarum TaxID=129788 RepID=UPI00295AE90C|nr:uncharacterized protein LOC132759237 [Ruditapes philippinarum]